MTSTHADLLEQQAERPHAARAGGDTGGPVVPYPAPKEIAPGSATGMADHPALRR